MAEPSATPEQDQGTASLCERCAGPTVEHHGGSYCIACDWHTNWPPTGALAAVWAKFEPLPFTDLERLNVRDALTRWMHETSTLMAFTDDNGEWVNVQWPWTD